MSLNKHLRRLWSEANYPDGMGSAAVTPPPREEYRRVYYTTSAEFAISNIVFGRIHSHICSVAYPVLDAAGGLSANQNAESDAAAIPKPAEVPSVR
jgi:hypothetical protein